MRVKLFFPLVYEFLDVTKLVTRDDVICIAVFGAFISQELRGKLNLEFMIELYACGQLAESL